MDWWCTLSLGGRNNFCKDLRRTINNGIIIWFFNRKMLNLFDSKIIENKIIIQIKKRKSRVRI